MNVRSSIAQFRILFAAASLAALLVSNASCCSAQQLPSADDVLPQNAAPAALNLQPDAAAEPTDTSLQNAGDSEKQSKRILWIFPNYRAVSAGTQLPPLSLRQKTWLATQDSFDYSSFISGAMLAGISQAKNSYPEFGHHSAAYGRYYWHTMADMAVGNYMTEAIVPTLTHEDPRYYTLGHGGFFKRTRYALTRLVVTRRDSGGETFNFSEIIGNGAGAGISNAYYPSREHTWTKTGQKWVGQIGLDGAFNMLKEFWPDMNRIVFHGKY